MMKKFRKNLLRSAVAGSLLAGLPAGAALALPIVGLSVNGGSLGDILSVEVVGPKGPLAIGVLGSQLPLPASIDVSTIDGLLSSLPDTGTPLDGLADMLPVDALPALPGLPSGDPLGDITALLPTGGAPGLPALPVDVVGTVTGLIPSGGAPGLPGLPALPVDPLGTLTGLIPAGDGTPGLPALPVDVVGTLTGLVSAGGGVPGLPALPVDPVATLTGLLPVDSLPLPLP